MSLRTKFANRCAKVTPPNLLKLKGGMLKFSPPNLLKFKGNIVLNKPIVSQSLLFRAKISRNLVRSSITPLVSHDLSPKACLAFPKTIEFNIIPSLPKTRSYNLFHDESVPISENLLTPIGKPDPKGKNYAAPANLPTSFPDSGEHRKIVSRPIRKAYVKQQVRTKEVWKTIGFWDTILPLLKPPINFDFPTQLDFPSELYPFQIEGIRRLVENESFLLADEMGTGKTVMASVALRILFQKGVIQRALIICPASVIPVWDQHLEDWGGACLTCTVVSGTKQTRQYDWKSPAHIYITSYDTFRNDVLGKSTPLLSKSALKKFDLVILDEAHHIRTPSSGRSRAVLKLTPKYRWALTGTPLQNKLDDLIAIFRFVKPGLLSNTPLSESTVKDLIEPYFLRRRKMDVIQDLPKKITQDIWLEMDPEQQEAYEEALGKGRSEFTSGYRQLTRIHIFALLIKLMQISNFAPGKTTSPKLEFLLDRLEEISLNEHKIAIFTNYEQEGINKIRPHLQKYGLVEITGKTPKNKRKELIDKFQNDPNIRIFLGTTKAAGEGITLTEASYVFHFDQWWNPAVAWQAEDRVHRKGQSKPVTIYNLWMKDTVEERIRQKLIDKGLLFEEVVNAMSEEEIKSSMTMEDWCEVLGLDVKLIPKQSKEKQKIEGTRSLAEIYKTISETDPSNFEHIVAEVFRRMGYSIRLTGQSYDGGIDIRASKSVVGGKKIIAIQCKHKPQVGVDVARELLGTVTSNPKISEGFLVVSGKLSPKCIEFIKRHGNLRYMEGLELAKRILELNMNIL